MTGRDHAADMAHVHLPDSWVLAVDTGMNSVSFLLEAALTPDHPAYYWPPRPGEQHPYALLRWTLRGEVHWNEGPKLDRPATDANDEIDFGNIDTWWQEGDVEHLSGEWGDVTVRSAQHFVDYTTEKAERLTMTGERFWDFTSDYGVQLPLTDAALAECERALGVVLPPEYVALLRVRNGGTVATDRSAFLTRQPTSWATDHVPFEDCSGIGDAFPSITDSPSLNAEWGQPEELVLLHGDGHWWVALDYRAGPDVEPAVVWFDNEVGEDVQLAASFADFVRGLTAPPPIED